MPMGVDPVAKPSTAPGRSRTREAMRVAIWRAISSYVSATTTGSRSANLAAPGAEHERHGEDGLAAHDVSPQPLFQGVDVDDLGIEPGRFLKHGQQAAERLDEKLVARPVLAASGGGFDHELRRGQPRRLVGG